MTTPKRRGWKATLFSVLTALVVMLSVGAAPAALADTSGDFKSAAIAILNSSANDADKQAQLLALVDSAGQDPDKHEYLMAGIDLVIGPQEEATGVADPLDRTTSKQIVSVYADMSLYTGVATDDVWKDVPGLHSWEIVPNGPNAATIKIDGFAFMWTRDGTPEDGMSDYALGLKRHVGSDQRSEPSSPLALTMDFGDIPASVKAGDTITITPSFNVAPWRVVYRWVVCVETPEYREYTGSNSYTTTTADIGCGILLSVWASKAGYTPVSNTIRNVTGQLIQVVESSTPQPPVVKVFSKTYAPTISGKPKVGYTLAADSKYKKWSPRPTSVKYQWNSDGTPITGATASKYKVAPTDIGHAITVSVTGSKAGYTSVTKISKPTQAVTPGTIHRGTVTVTGTRRVGKTLTAKVAHWSSGVTFSYKWKVWVKDPLTHKWVWKFMEDQTGRTYVLTPADRGLRFAVAVMASKPGYYPSFKTSPRTRTIRTGYLTTATPTITGNPVVGESLTANPGSWKPSQTAFTYQWYRGRLVQVRHHHHYHWVWRWYEVSTASGGKAAVLVVTDALKGWSLKVKVTGREAGYHPASRWSNRTAKVTVPVSNPEPTPSPSPTTSPDPTPNPTATP